jgi:hypothetical protein
MLAELFDTPVEVADIRDRLHHGLAVEIQDYSQDPMSGRMLGPHVQHHGLGPYAGIGVKIGFLTDEFHSFH